MKSWNKKLACGALMLFVGVPALAWTSRVSEGDMHKAVGEFEVKVTPAGDRQVDGLANGLFVIEKTLTGDLTGTSLGEMLTGMGEVQGSAAYVAVEKVTGVLDGREGSFMLAHKGVMSAEGQKQDITVVPDSGTGGLTGLSGTFLIIIEDGKHSYEFEFRLPSVE